MKRKTGFLSLGISAVIIALLVANYGCSKDDGNGGGGPVDVLSGVILAPDSVTPIAGATVYVPVNPASAMKTAFNIDTADCTEPDEAYIVYTCTDVDGSFELNITGVTATSFTLRVTKGSFQIDYTVNLNATSGNLGSLPLPSDPEQGAGNFAVVTGSYDRMQDILAKLGMGELDEDHMLMLGTETFDLYDGDGSLYGEYPVFTELFENDGETGNPVIYNYDMVFINCGSSYEYDVLYDDAIIAIIRNYVAEGGKLYVTDQAYDYVEQVFPGYIDFYGSDETDQAEKEEMNAAEVGDWGITSDATVNDSQLKAWLQTVLCEEGNCLNPDMTVTIAGFWGGWVVMNGAHPAQSSNVKIWITGPVSWYDYWAVNPEGSGDKPLTVTFVHGMGRVLYTSYHTEEDNPSDGFWPQERILQYLVLEL